DASKNHEAHGTLGQSIEFALASNIITDEEAQTLHRVDELYQSVINVDDFSPEELGTTASIHSSKEASSATPPSFKELKDSPPHRLN
ncbi:MAG TPA: DUF1974 domain-containing protein, partial [Candidatus Berkiella sp.]|nr:DUF1974 domain-containing protein [Candidatus Berkiella sp.]